MSRKSSNLFVGMDVHKDSMESTYDGLGGLLTTNSFALPGVHEFRDLHQQRQRAIAYSGLWT